MTTVKWIFEIPDLKTILAGRSEALVKDKMMNVLMGPAKIEAYEARKYQMEQDIAEDMEKLKVIVKEELAQEIER